MTTMQKRIDRLVAEFRLRGVRVFEVDRDGDKLRIGMELPPGGLDLEDAAALVAEWSRRLNKILKRHGRGPLRIARPVEYVRDGE